MAQRIERLASGQEGGTFDSSPIHVLHDLVTVIWLGGILAVIIIAIIVFTDR
jgi:putative copper export protein